MTEPKLLSVERKKCGTWLSLYESCYENADGSRKVYESVSRDPVLTCHTFGRNDKPNSVLMLIVPPGDPDSMLLSHEFRMPLNRQILSIPSGLIEHNESVEDACRRELKEESGLDLRRIINILPPSAIAPGITDDLTNLVICEAWGELKDRETASEHIENYWYTWGAVRNVLQGKQPFDGKTPYMTCSIQAQMAMLYGLAVFGSKED